MMNMPAKNMNSREKARRLGMQVGLQVNHSSCSAVEHPVSTSHSHTPLSPMGGTAPSELPPLILLVSNLGSKPSEPAKLFRLTDMLPSAILPGAMAVWMKTLHVAKNANTQPTMPKTTPAAATACRGRRTQGEGRSIAAARGSRSCTSASDGTCSAASLPVTDHEAHPQWCHLLPKPSLPLAQSAQAEQAVHVA